jgi:AcrR family transcriptional regulator
MTTRKKALSPRKKPCQERSVRMVDTILDAASRVLERYALAGYNTTAVAEQAGVSIGSIYQYFPNRDALTTELILRMHRSLLARLRKALTDTEGMSFQESLPILTRAGLPVDLKLARVLEFEEERLPRGSELMHLEREIDALAIQYIKRYAVKGASNNVIEVAAMDLVSISRGMMDLSISRSMENDDLIERIARAVSGCLAPLLAH